MVGNDPRMSTLSGPFRRRGYTPSVRCVISVNAIGVTRF